MLTRADNARFRPAIEPAWLAHCARTRTDPADAVERELWYRGQLRAAIGVTSTRDAESRGGETARELEAHFRGLAGCARAFPEVAGWSEKQNEAMQRLALRAYDRDISRNREHTWHFDTWLVEHLAEAGVEDWRARDNTDSFDSVMADLAVIADDERWIARTADAAERRMRHGIRAMLEELTQLTGEPHTWEYACATYARMGAGTWPDIEQAPSAMLRTVLAALDTHRRRKRERNGVESSAGVVPF